MSRLLLLLASLVSPAAAQFDEIQTQLEVEHERRLFERLSVGISQQLQFSPSWSVFDADSDIGELGFIDEAFTCREDDDCDDDADQEDETGDGGDDGDDEDGDDEDGDDPRLAAPGPSALARTTEPTVEIAWETRAKTSVGLTYRLADGLQAGVGYEYTIRPGDNTHELELGASYRHALAKRLRGQVGVGYTYQNDALSFTEGKSSLRFKTALASTRRPLAPFVETELLYRLDAGERRFDRVRTDLGLNWRFRDRHRVVLEYRLQQKFDEAFAPEGAVRLSYRFSL